MGVFSQFNEFNLPKMGHKSEVRTFSMVKKNQMGQKLFSMSDFLKNELDAYKITLCADDN